MKETRPTKGFTEFVGNLGEGAVRAWDQLSEGTRRDLLRNLDLMPKDLKGWRGLIRQAVEQVRIATGEKQRVAIVGPVNVGKSTLYNRLIRSPHDRASVSPVPGTTRILKQADAGIFAVVDTPGADAVGVIGEEERERAFRAAQMADLLVVLFDASHGIHAAEKKLFDDLTALRKPMIVVLNKMDLAHRERSVVLGKAAAALGLESEQVIPISAKKGHGFDRLFLAIVKSEPGIVAALGAALPEYRLNLAQATIAKATSTAAAIAATPLPFLDFFPLIGIQTSMVLGIARIYAYRITFARARELIGTFGIGLLGRTLFYELSKFGGPPGWLVAAGVAAGTTYALGNAAVAWFDRGEKLSKDALRRLSQGVGQNMVERMRSLGRKRPKRDALSQKVNDALQEMPTLDKEAEGSRETDRKEA